MNLLYLLVFTGVCTFAAVVLLIAVLFRLQADSRRQREELEARQVRMDALIDRIQQTTLGTLNSQMSALRSELLTANSDLKSSQGTHFVNFLGLVTRANEGAAQRSEALQSALMERFDAQTRAQENRLASFSATTAADLESLRKTIAEQLGVIRAGSEKTLEEIRFSVENKLQQTLSERLTSSFKTVEEQLAQVHRGLGEMRQMAQNVDGLRRVLTNVKTRGTFGEVQLGMILEQILTPEQYACNVATRPNSSERVEFAVKLPGTETGAVVWLPIDAKFPLEDYERLQKAAEVCDVEQVAQSTRALEARILLEAAKIHDKYVEVPYTTEFAVLYLPVESLWAEVIRCPGLIDKVQRRMHVTIAGPTVLAALLNSLQMGFRTLAIEKKSAEVWRLLGTVKSEFSRFNDVIVGVEKKIEGVRSALGAVRTRTNVMNRHLNAIDSLELTHEPQDADHAQNS